MPGLIPGANPSGTQNVVPTTASPSTPAIGGTVNPVAPQAVPGTSTPGTADPLSALMGLNPANTLGLNTAPGGFPNEHDFIGAMHKAGYSSGDAALLWQFLQSGAGYSPQVAQALLAALQPGVQRGQADILEQFSAQGLRSSSPAAISMGDFMSQVTLDEGQILSQMYEQAVNNYLEVILSGKKGGLSN